MCSANCTLSLAFGGFSSNIWSNRPGLSASDFNKFCGVFVVAMIKVGILKLTEAPSNSSSKLASADLGPPYSSTLPPPISSITKSILVVFLENLDPTERNLLILEDLMSDVSQNTTTVPGSSSIKS